MDIGQALGVLDEGQALRAWQYGVQRVEERFELYCKFGAHLFRFQCGNAGFGIFQRLDALATQHIHYTQMTISQHRHLVLNAT
ncbi:hypothetical protein D3C79_922330 [compost metagenome]